MKRILCFGDSNTWGHDPENGAKRIPDEARWPMELERLLGENYRVIEEGLCGRWTGSRDVADSDMEDLPWNGYQYFLGCMRSHKPLELVIIMLGTNDLQKARALKPEYTGEMLKLYVEAVKEICELSGDRIPEILLISPIAIDEAIVENEIFNEIFGAESLPKSEKLTEIIENTAKECGVHFLKGEDFAKASKLDGLHMNADSHKLFAKAVYKKIKDIYEEDGHE